MNTNTPPRFAPLPFLAHSAAAVIAAAAVIVAGVAFMPGRAGAREPAAAAASAPQKNLIVPGEVFSVDGHTAFLFTPAEVNALPPGAPRPWILYGPTLTPYPDEAEKWMHQRFTEAGVAVAGIDTGESYGSPAAVAATEKLHAEMVKRGYAAKPALLGRSRGGLWASAWAIAHPDLTAGLGGIYPVYDWRTYPGAEGAAGAYGLTPADLLAKVDELCPVENIDVAARAGIPVCIIHGDIDVVVPLEPNSGRLKARYEALGKGDLVELIVAEGQGHNFWEGFFHCQKLVDFLIEKASEGATGGDAAAAGE